jgi:hypothetical protein
MPYSLTGTPAYTLLSQFITYKSGKIQIQAINFPNSSNTGTTAPTTYITYPVSLNSTPGFTISLWVNFNVGGVFAQVVLQAGTRNILYLDNSNRLNYNDTSSTTLFPLPALTVGTWYNPVIVVSGTTATLYLNGQSTVVPTVTMAETTLRVGGGNGNYSAWCSVQDLRIYKTPLSAIQVQAIYANGGAPGVPASTTLTVTNIYAPVFSGYTYVSFPQLPSSFTLTQTSTGNVWAINSGQVTDGGPYPTLTLVPSQPSDIYSATYPGIWYRLQNSSTGTYVRHSVYVLFTQGYLSRNFDFAWAFYLKNGTTDQIKIYNPYGGFWVQSGLYTAGRIAISTQNSTLASIYTISTPINLTAPLSSMTGTSLQSQITVAPTASYSLRAVNGVTTLAVQVYNAVTTATQNFYADRLGNLLTAPVIGQTLASWLGGATGYVSTWYDQSGNGNHATQATQANRPSIQKGTKGPGYSVLFNGSTNYFRTSFNLIGTPFLICASTRRNTSAPNLTYVGTNGTSGLGNFLQIGYYNPSTQVAMALGTGAVITVPAYSAGSEPMAYDFLEMFATSGSGAGIEIWGVRNGTQVNGGNSGITQLLSASSGNVLIGAMNAGTGIVNYFSGEMYEILIFNQTITPYSIQIYNNQLSYTGL